MSDNEEENYCFYGKPLELYDEDSIPKKRPISIEDQVARDEKGRRRFHGAFTGGFSAGFYNTVGSLEGWTPTEFKSSRSEKAGNKLQKPEDYMDDEDIGEFGIAPQKIQATKDYNTNKKRKKTVFSDGPIPGEPVLHTLIESGNDTIGYLLLRNMGFKHSTEEEEIDEEDPPSKVYGCEMPKITAVDKNVFQNNIKLPEIYQNALKSPKSNTFGLSYVGLDKTSTKMFKKSNLSFTDSNNKKVSISGQAFGVGAFEEDDDDIYVKEDMSNYDFEMTTEAKSAPKINKSSLIHDVFVKSKKSLILNETFPPPTIPNSFTGKHKQKKSRFEPIEAEKQVPKINKFNADIRAKYLGEKEVESNKEMHVVDAEKETHENEDINTKNKGNDKRENTNNANNVKVEDNVKPSGSKFGGSIAGLVFDRFVSASKSEDHLNPLEPVERMEITHGTKDMREAARMKMYGPLTRITLDWTPASLICKRFNIPEPVFSDVELKVQRKERKRNLIFENEKFSEPTLTTVEPGLQIQTSTPTIVNTTNTNTLVFEAETSENKEDSVVEKPNEETPKKTIEITDKIDVAKNSELFKLIFQDSDDSDDEESTESKDERNKKIEEDEKRMQNEIFKQQVLSDDFLPNIKPLREGILSNITTSTFAQVNPLIPEKQPIVEIYESKASEKDSNLFGPELPTIISKSSDKKMECINISDDEWIEKNDNSSSDSDSSSKTKNKKHKHKHKKKHKKEKRKKKHKNKK